MLSESAIWKKLRNQYAVSINFLDVKLIVHVLNIIGGSDLFILFSLFFTLPDIILTLVDSSKMCVEQFMVIIQHFNFVVLNGSIFIPKIRVVLEHVIFLNNTLLIKINDGCFTISIHL